MESSKKKKILEYYEESENDLDEENDYNKTEGENIL